MILQRRIWMKELGSSDDYGEVSFKPDTFSPGANIIGATVTGTGEDALFPSLLAG